MNGGIDRRSPQGTAKDPPDQKHKTVSSSEPTARDALNQSPPPAAWCATLPGEMSEMREMLSDPQDQPLRSPVQDMNLLSGKAGCTLFCATRLEAPRAEASPNAVASPPQQATAAGAFRGGASFARAPQGLVASKPGQATTPFRCGANFGTDTWEEYALGMTSEEDCALLEEHLLVCSACQDLLAKVDEYVDVAKTAMALKAAAAEHLPGVLDFRTRRRLSKPVNVAAALAGGLILFR